MSVPSQIAPMTADGLYVRLRRLGTVGIYPFQKTDGCIFDFDHRTIFFPKAQSLFLIDKTAGACYAGNEK